MIDIIKQQIKANGDKAEIISIKVLSHIIRDIEKIKNIYLLNDFQKFIINDLYIWDLPQVNFEINSIIILATPSPLINLVFNKNGEKIFTTLPPTYVDYTSAPERVEKYPKELMNIHGYHIFAAPRLPQKLLAVRSGLSKYGRNNITYIDGMGSFFKLVTFYSDLPCEKEDLDNISQLDVCKKCTLCMKNCHTKAILDNRFLIDNQRCLTYFNEAEGGDFPKWIEKSAHNSIYGCIQCQIVCPGNRDQLNSNLQVVEFTEDETDMLLKGISFENFTYELRNKLESLGMKSFLTVIPRNLKKLFEKEA